MRGKPEKDMLEVKARWESEMADAGLSGSIEVEHSSYNDPAEKWSFGRALWEALASGDQLESRHAYYAEIPGARWPTAGAVLTTQKGLVTFITYRILLPGKIAGDLRFGLEEGALFGTFKFEGQGADELNGNADLKKLLKRSLSSFYQSTFSTYRFGGVAYCLSPLQEGTEVTVTTTIKAPPLGWGRKSFGLKKILAALEELEAAL